MAELLEDDLGRPKPQYEKPDGSGFEAWKGKDGHGNVRSDDGQIVALGSTTDTSEANTVIGKLTKLLESLPSAMPSEDIPYLPPDLRVALVMPVFGGPNPTICPVEVVYSQLPEGAATEAKQDSLAALVGAIEDKLDAVRVLLNTLAGKDFATQTTLAQILAKMIAAPATEAKQDALAGLVGALDSAAVSDPAAAGAVIALLKGLLSRLQTLENKIDSFTTGEETVNTELKGSLVQNAFEIIPSDAADLTHETIAIYVGFEGDVKVDLVGAGTVTLVDLAPGQWHPIAVKKVYDTGTTATNILGAYLI